VRIFVNATAADIGGLKTIVDQFLIHIKSYDKENRYYVFVSNDKFSDFHSEHIQIIKVDRKKWIKRFIWDARGMERWSKTTGIFPDKIISLQNTPVRFKGVSQFVYLHTPIPFVPYDWSLFNPIERKMWFYRNIYPFFIKVFLDEKCKIIVQAEWLKSGFLRRFTNVGKEQVIVVRPDVNVGKSDDLQGEKIVLERGDNPLIFFYPAIDYIYKNHLTLLRALSIIKDRNKAFADRVKVIFTLDKESWVYREAKKLNVEDMLILTGNIPFNKVLEYYKQTDAVLFPSYIETFGLPLLEAAYLGKPILCAEEEYAKEVLPTYEGVAFLRSLDEESWARAILEFKKREVKPQQILITERNGWGEFLSVVMEKKVVSYEN